MAKAKKEKPVVEEAKIEVHETPETITPTVEETLPIVEEPIIEVTESTVTKDDVDEWATQIKEARAVTNTEIEEDLSMEQKIVEFVDSRDGNVKLNDFLKSLFGVPQHNEPPKWLMQGNSRLLRKVIDGLVKEGKIIIENDNHLRLGQFYYTDNSPVTQHHSLNTLNIIAKK